jgi:rubrerythrin
MIVWRRPKARGDDKPLTARSLLALSLALEREAAKRYDGLAARMAGYGNLEVAELFASLAAEERQHETAVERLLASQGGSIDSITPPAAAPEAISFEAAAEAGGPHLMTPYRALRLASDAERRAFRYFIDIAADATDEALRRQAEALANEELDHLVRIRKERRRAWHAERRSSGALAMPIRGITTPETLLGRAHAIESEARAELASLAADLTIDRSGAGDLLADEARREAALLDQIEERSAARRVPRGDGPAIRRSGAPQARGATDALLQALSSAERACDHYLAIAEASPNEETLGLAQWLAEHATQRLRRLAAMLDRLTAPASN